MSHFTLSCTTCATRMPRVDEVALCFEHAPKVGYEAWGIAGPLVSLSQWVDAERLAQRAKSVGLTKCTEVYSPTFPTDSVEAAKAKARDLIPLYDMAATLESPLVVMTGRCPRTDVGLEATVAGIQTLLPFIEDRPIRLALEPHYNSQIQWIEDYDYIFGRIDTPQVGITLDSGHFHSAGTDWRKVIDKYTDRIYNFHVKDHIGTQSVAIGAGEIDLRAYFETLHQIDYKGALAVELEVEDFENLLRYGEEAFVYLRNLVTEITGSSPS